MFTSELRGSLGIVDRNRRQPSAGIKNASIRDALVDLLGKPGLAYAIDDQTAIKVTDIGCGVRGSAGQRAGMSPDGYADR